MEQPIPGFAICNLGAVNLALFVNGWFDAPTGKTEFKNKKLEAHIRKELLNFFDEERAEFFLHHIKWEELEEVTRTGLRFQDRVIDITYYPFEENKKQQLGERRVGLGFMALHDIMLYSGVSYGSKESVDFSDVLIGMMAEWCYLESVELAKENGPFPMFDADKFLQSGYMKQMAERKPHVVEEIKKHGVRNVTTMTVAPTGTTGTMVGVSTGCEPYYAWEYFRNSRLGLFMEKALIVQDYEKNHLGFEVAEDYSNLPEFFVTSMDLTPEDHVRVQASLQTWIDSSISKTCNAPEDYTVEDVKKLYELAYELGCKGVTIYRNNSRSEQVLELKPETTTDDSVSKATADVVAEKTIETIVEQPYVKNKRPDVLYGGTYKKQTPHGPVYITINDDPTDNLARELFVNIGKAGSDVFAANEALGRALTLYLKDSKNPNKEAALVKHFSGIGGQNSVGFGPNRILSVPDAIAKAMIQHAETFPLRHGMTEEEFQKLTSQPEAAQEQPAVKDQPKVETKQEKKKSSLRDAGMTIDICPSCSNMTLIKHGGCDECSACGYSKC